MYDHTRALVAPIYLAEEYLAKDIHTDVLPVDSRSCLLRKAVYNHTEKLAQERSGPQDNDRPGRTSGHTHTARNPGTALQSGPRPEHFSLLWST